MVQGQRLMQASTVTYRWVGITFRTAHAPITTFVNCATGKDQSRYRPSTLNYSPCTPDMRMDLGPGACEVWRSGRHCVLSRRQRSIRSSNCRFSAAYADKNERDFARLENAAAAGQIAVERGL